MQFWYLLLGVFIGLGVVAIIVFLPGRSRFTTTVTEVRGTAGRFAGIKEAFTSGAHKVQVLVVHGMGTPPEKYTYAIALGEAIARATGFPMPGVVEDVELPSTGLPPGARPAHIYVHTFTKASGDRLILHALSWWPLVHDIKTARLVDPDERQRGVRALLNNLLKRGLLNERLADPVLYLGPMEGAARDAVKTTLCRMVQGSYDGTACVAPQVEDDERIAIITLSLGSKITFDSIRDLLETPESSSAFKDAILPRLHGMYMFANQLPLLALGRASTHGKRDGMPSEDSLAVILRARAESTPRGKDAAANLPIVAINDPNDLLSYSLTKEFVAGMKGGDFYDVTTQIGRRYLLGLLANPLEAHTGHGKNETVFKMVIDGATATRRDEESGASELT